jgi:ribosomal protein S18 acetylase RimI-like enzyme
MEIRPAIPADVQLLGDIDATIESTQYLHVDRVGEGLLRSWRLQPRALREKLIQSGGMDEEGQFLFRQIATGADEGLALVAEHNDAIVALLLAQPDSAGASGQPGVLRVRDVRVDYDFRRQGLATALVFAAINHARQVQLRAVAAESLTNNDPAAELFVKSGFELAGIDDHRRSNHDLVKEAVTLFWYVSLD